MEEATNHQVVEEDELGQAIAHLAQDTTHNNHDEDDKDEVDDNTPVTPDGENTAETQAVAEVDVVVGKKGKRKKGR
jgi:hypothetical protein